MAPFCYVSVIAGHILKEYRESFEWLDVSGEAH